MYEYEYDDEVMMMNLINHLELTPGKYSCIFATISNILNIYDYSVSESDVYFLCDGMNVTYERGWTYVGYRSLKDILRNTKINTLVEIQYLTNYSEESIISFLLEALSNNCYPLISVIDPNVLKYNEWHMVRFDLWHCIAVYGIDIERLCLYVADSFFYDKSGKVKFFQGEMSYIDFLGEISELVVLKPCNKNIRHIDIMNSYINSMKSYIDEKYIFSNNFRRNIAVREHISDLDNLRDNGINWICNRIINCIGSCVTPMLAYTKSVMDDLYSDNASNHSLNIQNLLTDWNNFAMRVLKVKLVLNESKLPTLISDMLSLLDKQEEILYNFLKAIDLNLSNETV